MFLTGMGLVSKGPTTIFKAFCLDNYGGDTLTVYIPDLLPILGYHIKVRIKGIDALKINGKSEREGSLLTWSGCTLGVFV